MRGMGLEAKEGDIIFAITPIGRPPPYDHELSAENRKRVEEAMKKIRSLHLQAIYNAGAVRQVDRILAELLMAQFTRVNQMMGADLNTSLQEFFTVIETSGGILEELKTALGPTVSNLVPYNLQRVVESHNSRLYMSVTKVLVFLDCARREGRDFLEDLVKSLQTDEELNKLLTALSKWISAFEDHIWNLALSKELAKEEVALRVNLALTATRLVIGNYFNGVLEGLVGSLGIKIYEDEDPPCSTQEGLEKRLAKELEQLSVSAPSLEGCESRGLHVGYSLQYADHEKGPSVPALSSTALPDLLDAINRLWLGISTPSDEDQSSEEQQDLLESLAAKGVPRSSKTKDVYQKFVNILDARPHIRNPVPAPKPKVNPPMPPRQVDPPQTPATGNPTSIPGALLGSNWVPGKIPTDEEESKKLFSYKNPLSIKPAVLPPKVSVPIPPFPHQGSKSGEEELANRDPNGLRGVSVAPVRDTPVDRSRRDPSSDKMPKQEGSTPGVVGPTRGILCPSKLPRRDLKYSEERRTLLDSQGHLIGCMQLTDIAKPERGSASESGTVKRKEPDTPDLGSEGAFAPVQKRVRIEGATYQHGSAPSIHIGASLHDVPERDEDDDYEKDGEEGNEDYNEDVNQGDTPKDEENEEEDDDEDNAQFVDIDPVPPKCWDLEPTGSTG